MLSLMEAFNLWWKRKIFKKLSLLHLVTYNPKPAFPP